MIPELLGNLVDALIPILAGFVCLLAGFGLIGRKKQMQPEERPKTSTRSLFVFLGIGLLCIGVLLGLTGELRRNSTSAGVSWQSVSTDDGVATVEMPGVPRKKIDTHNTELGVVEIHRLLFEPSGHNISYGLSHANIPDATTDVSIDDRLDPMGEHLANLLGGKVVRSARTEQAGWPGVEVMIEIPKDKLWCWSNTFLINKRTYTARVVIPQDEKYQPDVERFLASFKIRKFNEY